jgi:hypothetical protein
MDAPTLIVYESCSLSRISRTFHGAIAPAVCSLKQSENEVRLPAAHELSWRLVECPNPLGLLRYLESKPHHVSWLMLNVIAYWSGLRSLKEAIQLLIWHTGRYKRGAEDSYEILESGLLRLSTRVGRLKVQHSLAERIHSKPRSTWSPMSRQPPCQSTAFRVSLKIIPGHSSYAQISA